MLQYIVWLGSPCKDNIIWQHCKGSDNYIFQIYYMHQVTDFLFSVIKEYLEHSDVDEVLVRTIIKYSS